MRASVCVGLAAALGIAVGLGFTWAEFHNVEESFALPSQAPQSAASNMAAAARNISHGHVVVTNGEDFNFGSMERETERSHVFVLKNEGTAAVKVTAGKTTCKCTSFKVAKESLEPGEATDATVTWKPVAYDPNFHQRAEIQVANDPERPIIGLTVHGMVVQRLRADPEDIVLNDVSNMEPQTRQLRVLAYYHENLRVVETKFDQPETAEYYNVTTEPLPPAEVQQSPGAKSGVLVTVHVKPGLPLGPIRQTVRLITNEDKGAAVALPVHGRMISDISIAGDPRYSAETGVLKFGEVSREEGAEARLRVFVRGPERNHVQLTLGEVDPAEFLQVRLGEAKALANATMYDFTVTVPPGTKFVNRLGTAENKVARITLNTTSAHAPKLQLLVQFAVTQ